MNIIPFQFESNNVRVIKQDGEPWFVAKDVATLLGYSNPRKAIRDHCIYSKSIGGNESFLPLDAQIRLIPEQDVYRLIMKSKLPAAQKFERWVMDEVLPSIRKKGSYSVDDQGVKAPTTLKEALEVALKLEEHREALEQKVAVDAPKVEFHDRVAVPFNSMTVGEAAKVLGTGRNTLFEFLRFQGWVQRNNEPYQAKINQGFLNVKLSTYQHPSDGEKTAITTLVTGKGLERLQKLWDEQHLNKAA